MPELVLTADQVVALRDHLLQDDGLERLAYVFCTESGAQRLLAAVVRPVPDEHLRLQGPAVVGPTQAYEREVLETCTARGYHPLELHSHPFSSRAGFSGIDIGTMDDHTGWLHALAPDVHIAFGVLAQQDLTATVFDPEFERFQELSITVLGNWTLDAPLGTETEQGAIDSALHDRSIRLLTEAGQRRLAALTVAVVGTGGLGFVLAKQLARLGVKQLVLIDPDTIERSNLNRLPGTSIFDVGRPKVTVLAQQLHDSNLDVEVDPVADRVEAADTALEGCDLVIGTVDQVSTRGFLNQWAVNHLRYYLDAGSVIRTEDEQVSAIAGIVQLVVPGVNACYSCLDRVDPEVARRERLSDEELAEEVEAGYVEASALTPEPAVITLNGTIASLAAAVVTRLAAGYTPPPDMVRYNELGWDLIEISTNRDPTCPVCGETGILGQGDREPHPDDIDPADTDLDLELPADDTEPRPAPRVGPTRSAWGRWLEPIRRLVSP